MNRLQAIQPRRVAQIPVSPLSRFLFSDPRMAWLWLIVRCYVGYQWLSAGWGKLTGYSLAPGSFGRPLPGGSWVFSGNGEAALKGFIGNALTHASGPYASVQSWYADFLQYMVLPHAGVFTYVVTFGEVFVGLGLIFGVFTGIAAFFGVFMNMNYLLSGSISINPVLGLCALLLVLAWRISGYYGVDRYLLPLVGTPWTGSLTTAVVKETVRAESRKPLTVG